MSLFRRRSSSSSGSKSPPRDTSFLDMSGGTSSNTNNRSFKIPGFSSLASGPSSPATSLPRLSEALPEFYGSGYRPRSPSAESFRSSFSNRPYYGPSYPTPAPRPSEQAVPVSSTFGLSSGTDPLRSCLFFLSSDATR